MRKISTLILLSMIINIFSTFTVYAEEKNGVASELLKERIVFIADDVGISEEEVDRYLSEYNKADDLVYDLIKYKKYLEHNPNNEILFDDFKNGKYNEVVETMSYVAAQNDVPGTIFMPTEQEERDYRNYTMTNGNERINYATGVLSHEETDFILPGVNGLDFALTVRFNQEETALGMPGAVPTFEYEDSPTYSTFIFGYTSAAEERCGIGAGWSFALPYVEKDINERDRYYIRLADGSTIDTGSWGRKTKDITFEVSSGGDYVVTYKNGTKDYFNDKGIIRTEDRYGNYIQYFYANDGLLEKVIDSAGRNITFERTYRDDTNQAEVAVYVDGQWMCEYGLEKNVYGKYMMREKQTKNKLNYYFYNKNDIEVKAPMAYNSAETSVFTIDEIVNYCDNYSYKYEYNKGRMQIKNDDEVTGFREFMRVTNRKTIGIFSQQDEIADEINYQYSTNEKNWWTPYKVSEIVAQTGMKTQYMTNDYFGLIRTKEITAPDTDVSIKIDYSYDDYNLMESYTQHTYSPQGETNVTESYENDEKGNVISHTDKFGTKRMYTYDEDTNVITRIEEPISRYGTDAARYITNTLDEYGNIVRSNISDSNSNVVQSVISIYDSYGNVLSKQTVPEYMDSEYFEYTADHANVKKHMKGDTIIAEYTYDNLGRKISETNSLGQTTQYKYNAHNEVVEIINPDNTNTKNLYSKDVGYIFFTNVYFNEKGPVKKETLDDFGRVTSISNMSILESANKYNNVHHFEDFCENDIRFTNVAFNENWEEQDAIQYDSIGRVTQVSNVNGITKYEYDNFNRIIKKINPDLSEKRIEYDDIERIVTTYDEEGNKSIEKYDAKNRVIEQTIFPEGNTPLTQSTEYDRTGQISSITDYNGNTTEYDNDALGRQVSVTDASGKTMHTRYADDFSYTTEYFSDGTVRQSSYYDELGRLSAVTDEFFNVNNYMYDTAGNLIESIDKNGNSTRYTYNSRNAVTNIETDDVDRLYVYDETGKVRAVENRKANSQGTLERENRIQYNYRVNGLVNAETDFRLDGTSRVTFNTQYNKIGSPTGFTVRKDTGQEIKNTQYTRDEMDRVNDIGQIAAGVQNKNVGCEYYVNGWLKKETLPNGYSNNYIYDGAGRMTELNRLDANGVSVLKYSYTYDNNGNRTKVEETESGSKVTTTYEYDKLNRLVKEVNGHSGNTTAYKFDARNNITEKTVSGTDNYTESYIYTSEHTDKYMSNRIIEVTKKSGDTVLGRTYYYQKPNGNTYKKIVTNEYGEPSEITDYTYNSWNLMESASVQKGNIKTDVTFKYDATNRRNGKITKVYENGRLTDSKTTEYIWYGDKVQYEEVTQHKQVTSNVNMWGVTGIAARNEKLFSSDAHGNTDAGYDGTSTKRYTYDAYGNAISDDGEDDNPYRYCGENYDEETGLYYLRARYYDPSIGRFMSEDPAQDGLNWYVYCGNNPVMFVDPSGLDAVIILNSQSVALNDYIGSAGGNNTLGHLAVVIQDVNGDWYYFSSAEGKITKETVPKWALNSEENFNKYISTAVYWGDYDKATYVTANTAESYNFYENYYQNNKDNGNAEYDFKKNNCSQFVMEGLRKATLYDNKNTTIDSYLPIMLDVLPKDVMRILSTKFYNNCWNYADYIKTINDQLWEARYGLNRNWTKEKDLSKLYYRF